jgi:hypothetical protein
VAWYSIIQSDFQAIKNMVQQKEFDPFILENYRERKTSRLEFLRTLLLHPYSGLIEYFEKACDFPNFLANVLIKDTSKFELILKVVPSGFARFNHSYPLRNEAIAFLREIKSARGHCMSFFEAVKREIQAGEVITFEGQLVRTRADRCFRRTSMRLLTILSTEHDIFELNEEIVASEALRLLKQEALNDWEDFQLLRGTWDRVSLTGRGVLEKVKELYESI